MIILLMRYEKERFAERGRRRVRGSILGISAAPMAHDQKAFRSCKVLLTIIFLADCATLIFYMIARFGSPAEGALLFALRIDGVSGFLVLIHVAWICQLFINMRNIVFPNAPSMISRRPVIDNSSKLPTNPPTEIMAASHHHLLTEIDLTCTRKLNFNP